MSQRPPKKSGKSPSRRNRKKKNPTPPPPMKTTGAGSQAQDTETTDGDTRQPAAESRASRTADRRSQRRVEAEKKAKQKKQMQLLGGGVAIAVVVAILLILVNRPSNEGLDIDYDGLAFAPPPITAAASTPAATPEDDAAEQPYIGARLGDPDAPVTMVIYADFQCPYCRVFASDTEPKIIDDFVRPGKVQLEFREFPVLGGPDLTDDSNESAQSAEAALCAAEQGSYLEYHDKLYANQQGENQGNFSDKRLKQFADELDLDTDAFNTCLDSGQYESAIQQSKEAGTEAGITATPMFTINGSVTQMTDQGYDLLKKQLEAAIETAQ